jgi:hypothetical protein
MAGTHSAQAPPSPWVFVAAIAVASIASTRPAHAANPERAHLRYDVPSGCPAEADFLDMVARDGGSLVRAGTDERARTFTIVLAGVSPVTGRLVVREEDGTEAVRAIAGDHCDEVARALAVLVALSAHPTPAADGPVPPMVTANLPKESPSPRPSDARPSRWRFGLSLAGTYSGEAGTRLVPGYAGFLELEYDRASVVSPSFRLGADIGSSWTNAKPAMATFGMPPLPTPDLATQKTVARLEGCPFRWVAAQPWATDALTAQTCARVDVGRLDAYSSTFSTDSVRPWVAVGATLRARWAFPRVFFEYEGGAMFPLIRERYYALTTELFAVPAAAFVMNFGIGGFIL